MVNKKILIVDDEEDVVSYLQTIFIDNGFEVVKAYNGTEARNMAESEKPDLITLDITMPEESGVKAYRDLQENDTTKNIPIIIITGIDPEFKKFISSRKQVKPPEAYFEKPIDRDELLNKVNEILNL